MSYCRFSSDDFTSDVYVYADVNGGYTTHVAGNRFLGEIPKMPPIEKGFSKEELAEYFAAHKRQMAFLDTAERVDIGLACDGESFNDATPGECADRLEYLRSLGYNVPQYAIDALREEANET